MNRDSIINELITAQWLKQSCKKIGGCNHEDLHQEFMLIVLQKTEDELIEIHPYLKWWTIRTLVNISNPANHRKDFYKKYLAKHEKIETIKDCAYIHEHNYYEYMHKAKEKVMADESIYWFDKELFILYEKGEKYSTIAKRTRIYHKTVKESISKIKELIKKEYEYLVANCCDTEFGDNHG